MQRLMKKGWKAGALAAAIVLVPTAAFAAIGTFTNTTAAPAVTGTNSLGGRRRGRAATFGSSVNVTGAANLKNTTITGTLTQTGAAVHNGAVTVNGTTALNDNVTIAGGKTINCTACVTPSDVSVPIPGVNVQPFGGSVANGTALSGAFQFIGPTVSVTVGAGQKLVFDDAIQLGSTAGATISPSACYSSGGPVNVFDGNYLDVLSIAAGTRRDIHVSDAVAIGPNTYTVGFCAVGGGTLDSNDYSQGYVMAIG